MKQSLSFYVVDDDPFIVRLITKVLEEAGHTVRSSMLCSDAVVQEIAADPPDCVLSDIMMPEIDGFEFCRRLRALPELAHLKLIIISGKTYDFDRRRAREFGADGYINKPVVREVFLEKIMEIIADKVEVRYWGVRGTLPVSGRRSLRYGGNTNCISMRFQNDQFFIFDAGTGIKELSNHLLEKRERVAAKIFISHPHWDHVNALPFFVPLYIQGNEFEIIGSAHGELSMRELVSAQMDCIHFPITMREFAARVYFRNISVQQFDFDGVRVETILLHHPGTCLGYRVEYKGRSIAYMTDNEIYFQDHPTFDKHYFDTLTNFLSGTDILITDTTYTDEEYRSKIGWGHSCVGRVVDLAHAARVKELHLFHHDPDQDDDAIDAKLAKARQGLEALGSETRVRAPIEGEIILL
jgi:phosphoribosyl 1,2-cyclic phosphodiesterase